MLFGQKNIARYISAQQQNYILRNDANMYIRLIRNEAKGNALTGRLVIDGRWFCYTLERVGYQIPALCYHVCVTQSPRFKRLLPIVQNVPQRSGIRIHRGSKPEHSSGCVLVVADNTLRGKGYGQDKNFALPKYLRTTIVTMLRSNQCSSSANNIANAENRR